MSIVTDLRKLYFEIDDQYSMKEFHARSKGQVNRENYWKKKRELNAHAYFLFLFTRLEDIVTTRSTSLIEQKKTNIGHWKTRAIWENTDSENMHFKKRLGLLTQKGMAEYNKISEYYKLRNDIGHGKTIASFTSTIDMITVFDNMKVFFKTLK